MTYREDIQRIESQSLRLILNNQASKIDELRIEAVTLHSRIEVLLAKVEVLEQKIEQDIINNKVN
jgi:hypothetical protein